MNVEELKTALNGYLSFLQLEEYAAGTLRCYHRDIDGLICYLDREGHPVLTKEILIIYKSYLQQYLKPVSVNRHLNTINSFLRYLDLHHLIIKTLKVQYSNIDDNILTLAELRILVNHAYSINKKRIAKIMLTLAGTGIRIGELKAITVSAVLEGRVLVHNKGKFRYILLPADIQEMLSRHCLDENLVEGSVFINKQGQPLSRSYIADQMKQVARQCDIDTSKVFPHNFRHLFARAFLDRGYPVTDLADHLGHVDVNTTRRYLLTSSASKQIQLSKMQMSLGTPFHILPHK